MYNNRNGRFMGHRNNLLNRHQQYSRNNVPFRNNSLLSNNIGFSSSYGDHRFQQQLYMAKMERIKRAKMMESVNLSNDDLVKYVIQPMQVNRATKAEVDKDYVDRSQGYNIERRKRKYKKGEKKSIDANGVLDALWKGRTNQPYKNICKKHYKKEFSREEDLIIHKVTAADRDKKYLDKEYSKLKKKNRTHNKQLKEIFSKSEKYKHKKAFQYAHVYKYRLKSKAKNFEEMKQFYKKEQRKINKDELRIDMMLNTLLNSDLMTDDKKKALQSEISKIDNKFLKYKKNKLDANSQLEQIKDSIGEKEYQKILKDIEKDESNVKIKKSKRSKRSKEDRKTKSIKKSDKKKTEKSSERRKDKKNDKNIKGEKKTEDKDDEYGSMIKMVKRRPKKKTLNISLKKSDSPKSSGSSKQQKKIKKKPLKITLKKRNDNGER